MMEDWKRYNDYCEAQKLRQRASAWANHVLEFALSGHAIEIPIDVETTSDDVEAIAQGIRDGVEEFLNNLSDYEAFYLADMALSIKAGE